VNRLQRLRSKLEEKELEAIVIAQPENRYYLSGFTGSDGWLLITNRDSLIAVDFRYLERAKKETINWEVVQIKGKITDWLPEIVSNMRLREIGFEADYTPVSLYNQLVEMVKEKQLPFQLIATSGLVESLRAIKEPEELEFILKAANLTDRAFEYTLTTVRPNMTEMELSWEIEKFLRDEGSDTAPFELIVASGPNSALPHSKPSDRKITPGEPILIDIGAKIDGYCSDLSRTFCLGKPEKQFATVYEVVLGAQLTALATIQPGIKSNVVDSSARTVIEEAGYGKSFGHGLGHGIGLAPHESPRLSLDSTEVLIDNMVFTIEPGIYIEGWGGVRIEDIVALDSNKLKILSKAPKNLKTMCLGGYQL